MKLRALRGWGAYFSFLWFSCAYGEGLKDLSFLEGTWEAKTQGGTAGAAAAGTYAFVRELGGHVLARHSNSSGCQGPANFDCEHKDLLYIYEDAPGQPVKAIYFDNEGRTIHYDVSVSAPGTVTMVSSASSPGPQFRLVYERAGTRMSGKFQMKMPGDAQWKSYLEWSGAKR